LKSKSEAMKFFFRLGEPAIVFSLLSGWVYFF